MVEIDLVHLNFRDHSRSLRDKSFGTLHADRLGNIYLPGYHGVMIFANDQEYVLTSQHGLPTDSIGPVLLDRDGSLWLGTFGDGLLRRLGQGDWTSWNHEDGLNRDVVWAVHPRPGGDVWVGTEGGLNIIQGDGKVVRSIQGSQLLFGNTVFSVAEDGSGNIFVGTDPLGISVFDPDGHLRVRYGIDSGLSGARISDLAVDLKGILWAVGPGGIFRSSTTQWNDALRFQKSKPAFPADEVLYRQVRIAPNGDILVASSQGLLRRHGDEWTAITQKDGLRSDDLSAVAVSGETVWVSYRDSLGISKIDHFFTTPRLTHLGKQQGMASEQVVSLAPDQEGRLWMGTDRGVEALQAQRFRQFGTGEGLIWDDTDGGAVAIDQNGALWIGTSRGLSRFAPNTALLAPTSHRAILTSIQTGNQQWAQSEKPVLPFRHATLDIRFANLDYAHEASRSYVYRVLGAGTEWAQTRTNSVHLAGLSPGSYTFELATSASGSEPASEVQSFTFTIETPWWRTWWFYAFSALVLASIIVVVWKVRIHILKRRERWLEKEVLQRTVELRESEKELQVMAYSDGLTALPNRRSFNEHLQQNLEQQGRFALALLDLDRFKQVNDDYGHDAGDAVLVQAAERFCALLREGDTAYRLGGDEFAILISSLEETNRMESFCCQLIRELCKPMQFSGSELHVGCSIGIAVRQTPEWSPAGLYKAADSALYEAKRAGKGTFRINASH